MDCTRRYPPFEHPGQGEYGGDQYKGVDRNLYPWWGEIHSIVSTLKESDGCIQNFGKIADGNHGDVTIIYMYCFLQTLKMLKLKRNKHLWAAKYSEKMCTVAFLTVH